MNKKLLLFIFTVFSFATQAQWIQVNGPKDSFGVYDMIARDSVLLVSASCGSFYSTDLGSTWTPVAPEVFYSSALFHDTIYTGGEHYHLYGTSTIRKMTFVNGTWQGVDLFQNTGPVNDLFADHDTIFAALANDGFNPEVAGFAYSVDGINWARNNTGLPKDSIFLQFNIFYVYNLFAVSADPHYIYVGTNKGIYRSQRSPINWSSKNSGLPPGKVNAIYSNDTVLFIALTNKMYKSFDQGESWTEIKAFDVNNSVNRILLINDTLFTLTQTQGIFLSGDWGNTWSPDNNGLTSLHIRCIAKVGPSCFAGSDSGIEKGPGPWALSNNNIICSDIRDIEQTDSCIAAIDYNSDTNIENVIVSKDSGATWIATTPFQLSGSMYSIVNVNGCLFFSFNPGYPDDCINFFSCDQGTGWTQTAPLVNTGDPYVLRSNGSKIVAFTYNLNHIFISSDNGTTWTDISPPAAMFEGGISDVLFTGNYLYAASANHPVIVSSSDYGSTWNYCGAGFGSDPIILLGSFPGSVFAFSSSGLSKSNDNGQTWLTCGTPGDGVLDFAYDNNLIFACKNKQVFFSRNAGTNWIDISAGLPVLPDLWGGTLIIRDHYLYFGTNNFGIWKTSTENLPSSVNDLSGSRGFELYPNPADNELNILSLDDKQIKRIDILDLSGRVIHTGTVRGNKIETDFLDPGLYLLRIETTDNKSNYLKFVKR